MCSHALVFINNCYSNEEASEIDDWRVEIQLSEEVETFKCYNGQVEKISDRRYAISPPAYNARVSPGGQALFQVHVTYDRQKTEPALQELDLNGNMVKCRGEENGAKVRHSLFLSL